MPGQENSSSLISTGISFREECSAVRFATPVIAEGKTVSSGIFGSSGGPAQALATDENAVIWASRLSHLRQAGTLFAVFLRKVLKVRCESVIAGI